MSMKEYIIDTEGVAKNKYVESNCSGILFVNKGTNPVKVNGLPLSTDQSLEFTPDGSPEQGEVEVDRTQYNVVFDTSGAGTSLLFVVRKKYKGVNYN
jgi:hypothetical protein